MIKIWLLAIRPKTLTAAVVPVVAAAALVHFRGSPVSWWIVASCLGSALFIQIATNLFNDAIDFRKGADGHDRLGPTRVTQKGLVSEKAVWRSAYLSVVMAILLGVPLVYVGGWPIVAIGLVSIFLAYAYTGGPVPLAYKGLGDLFVILFFGLIAVGGVYYLMTKQISVDALILGFQIGMLSTVLLAINNLRDIEQDRRAHKKTLAVRFGKNFVRVEIALMLILPFLLQVYWWQTNGLWASLLPLILLPIALRLASHVKQAEPSSTYNEFLARAAMIHCGFGGLISVGLMVG